MKIGGIPNKGKVDFSTRMKLKFVRWNQKLRQWNDPEIRKELIQNWKDRRKQPTASEQALNADKRKRNRR